MIQIIT